MQRFLSIALALSLAGCATAAERLAADNAHCQSMGLKFGTPEFAQCRMVQDLRHDADRRAAAAAISAAGRSFQTPSVNVYHYGR